MRAAHAVLVISVAALIAADTPKSERTDQQKLQGLWNLVKVEAGGKVLGKDKIKEIGNFGIDGDKLFSPDRKPSESIWHGDTFSLDTSKKPNWITIHSEGPDGALNFNGIYFLDEERLIICLNENGTDKARPDGFKTKEESPFILFHFERSKR
jgi:uncharacterized protein (TIGR03067 family)